MKRRMKTFSRTWTGGHVCGSEALERDWRKTLFVQLSRYKGERERKTERRFWWEIEGKEAKLQNRQRSKSGSPRINSLWHMQGCVNKPQPFSALSCLKEILFRAFKLHNTWICKINVISSSCACLSYKWFHYI